MRLPGRGRGRISRRRGAADPDARADRRAARHRGSRALAGAASVAGIAKALGITLSGPYSIENDAGFRFEADTDIAVALDGSDLYLRCGGLTINMGTSMTLTRVAGGDPYAASSSTKPAAKPPTAEICG